LLETVKPVRSESFVSLDLLRKRIPPEFQNQFCQDALICLDCGGHLEQKDDELSCVECGRIWSDDVAFEEGIPFDETSTDRGHSESHWSPEVKLSFGKGLGPGVDGRQLFRILGKAPSGNVDLPLRAAQIRCITQRLDHPAVENLLAYGSKLCKDYGLHTYSEENVQFANLLGKQLRKIGGYFVARGESRGELRPIANVVFYMLYVEKTPREAERLFRELALTTEMIRYVQTLLAMLTPPPKAKKPKQTSRAPPPRIIQQ
jgi:hypothetical protein